MPENFENKTIMLVDDDHEVWLKYLHDTLANRFDSTIMPFASFAEAEYLITGKSFNVDLIILDLIDSNKSGKKQHNGEKKGLELARYVKNTYKIPVIIVTLNKDLFDALGKEGYSGVFYKDNFSRIAFIEKIEEVLRKSGITIKGRNRKNNDSIYLLARVYSILDKIPIWYPSNGLKSRAEQLQTRFQISNEENIKFVSLKKDDIMNALALGRDKISEEENVANKFINMLENLTNAK